MKSFWTPSKAYLSAISKIQELPLPHENYLEDDLPDWVDDYGSLQGIIPIADLLKYKYEGRGFEHGRWYVRTIWSGNSWQTSEKLKLKVAGERIWCSKRIIIKAEIKIKLIQPFGFWNPFKSSESSAIEWVEDVLMKAERTILNIFSALNEH